MLLIVYCDITPPYQVQQVRGGDEAEGAEGHERGDSEVVELRLGEELKLKQMNEFVNGLMYERMDGCESVARFGVVWCACY
jgi:hypothetical protein